MSIGFLGLVVAVVVVVVAAFYLAKKVSHQSELLRRANDWLVLLPPLPFTEMCREVVAFLIIITTILLLLLLLLTDYLTCHNMPFAHVTEQRNV